MPTAPKLPPLTKLLPLTTLTKLPQLIMLLKLLALFLLDLNTARRSLCSCKNILKAVLTELDMLMVALVVLALGTMMDIFYLFFTQFDFTTLVLSF